MTVSNNYDCGCLAARSWIHWRLHSQVYFCCPLASLPLTPGISICKILFSVSVWLSTFWREGGFFFILPFSHLVLSRITAKGRLQRRVKMSSAESFHWKYQNSWDQLKSVSVGDFKSSTAFIGRQTVGEYKYSYSSLWIQPTGCGLKR